MFWMSAIFLLPMCMTYWPRKYTTRVDPHVDNSHQVWSWYDHPLPSYSVFVCWYVTWPGDLDLEQLSYMAGHVTNPATVPPSLKTLRLFVHELRVITVPTAYHWKCVRDHCWQVRRNGYLWTSGVNLDTAVRFDDPDFLVRVQNFGNLAMFSVDFAFYMPNVHHISTSGLFDLESIPHASTPTSIILTKFEAPTPIRSWVMSDNVSHWLPLKMRTLPLQKQLHFLFGYDDD